MNMCACHILNWFRSYTCFTCTNPFIVFTQWHLTVRAAAAAAASGVQTLPLMRTTAPKLLMSTCRRRVADYEKQRKEYIKLDDIIVSHDSTRR